MIYFGDALIVLGLYLLTAATLRTFSDENGKLPISPNVAFFGTALAAVAMLIFIVRGIVDLAFG